MQRLNLCRPPFFIGVARTIFGFCLQSRKEMPPISTDLNQSPCTSAFKINTQYYTHIHVCSQLGAVYMWETESCGKFIDCARISFRKTVQRSAAANPVKQISFLSGSSSTEPIDQSASHNSAAGINKQKNVAEEINKQENAAVEINKQENAGDS